MLISLILVGFILWLFFKSVGLALRMTWGLAKLIGVVLMTVALPVAGVCVFMGLQKLCTERWLSEQKCGGNDDG